MSGHLKDRRIALAESRELDLLAGMLEREGAQVVRCPLVSIIDSPDVASVENWLRRVIAGSAQDIVFYTGEGLRRLLGFAERAGVRQEFIAALARVRKITRGPKPVRALREVGLSPDLTADTPTTEGLIALLAKENLRGRAVGVQMYGQEPNSQFIGFLTDSGAVADVVAPYVYASEAADLQVQDLIRAMAGGEIDVIAFTSSPQIRRLEEVAEKAHLADELRRGLERTRVAAVGPIVAKELTQRGIRADGMPENSYTMKPLVRVISAMFAPVP